MGKEFSGVELVLQVWAEYCANGKAGAAAECAGTGIIGLLTFVESGCSKILAEVMVT